MSEHDRRGSSRSTRKTGDGVGQHSAGPAHATSGKQTLVQQLETTARESPVGSGVRDPTHTASVHAAAARGIEGSSGALPFAGVIQRAFGHHDIGNIEAHTDGAAAEGARAMGAQAFATGHHVAFASSADLHTAAHEAAHVVQQRAGVHVKSAVGEVGDAHEDHANQVADRVVAGRSAEDLLDRYAGSVDAGGSIDASAAVADAAADVSTVQCQSTEARAPRDAVTSGGRSARGASVATGHEVQRSPGPAKVVELHGKAAEAKLAELGGKFLTDPDFSDGHKAIKGSYVQYTVLGPKNLTVRLGVHQWTHDGPDGFHMQSITGASRADPIPSAAVGPNGLFVNAHNVGSTTIPLSKPGAYTTRAWVRAGVDEHGTFVGYELYLDHVIEVTHIERAIHEAEQKLPGGPDSFDRFHDTMSVQTALLRPGDTEAQNRDHPFGIATSAPNPSPISEGTLAFSARDARQDRSKPVTYHWYVSAQTKDKPPQTLGGKPMVAVAGRQGYDFGAGTSIAMPGEHAGFWVVWYQAKDAAGNDAGEASYLQTILSGSDMKSLEKHDHYMERLDELGGKIQGEKLPVRAVHVSEASGATTQLRLFLGKKDPTTFLLIDATPGVDPKSNRLEYTSGSGPGVVDEFFSLNKYPKGRLRLNVPPNHFGIDFHMYEKETTGRGTFDRLSSNLSIGGMVALGVGILAAPITRGQSLQVAMVVAGGLNAAAGAVSLYERLHNAEISGTGVALDIVNIASGLLNAGGAVRSLAAGPGILLANRATKFLLWANFAADGASALLIGAEGVQQIADIIDNEQLRPEQKREAVIRVVTNLIMAGTMLAVSYGQVREFRGKLESVFGKAVAGKLSDEACMALSMLDDRALHGLKGVAEPELAKLGRAIREEPAIMNLVEAEHRLPKILLLMKDGGADDLRFAIMRTDAHEAGVSVTDSQRLATALATAKVPTTIATSLGKDFLSRFADSAVVTELENVVKLQQAGRLKGIQDWVAFSANKASAHLANLVLELREAQRQVAGNPKNVVHIGNDQRAPLRTSGERMRSFDQTVETRAGAVETSVEVTSIADPLEADADLSTAVKHGIGKVRSRVADKAPIPGEHHLTIYAEISKPTMTKKGTRVIDADGNRVLHTKNGLQIKEGNLFANMAEHISTVPDNHLLDLVTVVDRHTGRVVVEFRFDPSTSTWLPVTKK
jgi:uncharacterized protein DUF4157